MEVRKESNGLKNSMVTREELAIINQFTKRALKEDEVYTFAVRLCDNEVDRDGERFPRETLAELAELFVGKRGIFGRPRDRQRASITRRWWRKRAFAPRARGAAIGRAMPICCAAVRTTR